MKTKITLMTIIATVALAGAAISANAQCGYGYGRVVIRGPRIFIPAPRVYVPAPRVWIPPVPVPPAPVVGYYGGDAYYGHPVYRERFEGRWDRDRYYDRDDRDRDRDGHREYRRDRW